LLKIKKKNTPFKDIKQYLKKYLITLLKIYLIKGSFTHKFNFALKDHLHRRHLLALTPATATSVFTCLGHLGQHDTDRIVSIYKSVIAACLVASIIAPTSPM
jgi:hypothetical protein